MNLLTKSPAWPKTAFYSIAAQSLFNNVLSVKSKIDFAFYVDDFTLLLYR